jgi:hypothetical protein
MPYHGFIFFVDEPERADAIREYLFNRGEFTDTVSVPDWRPKQAEIAYICFSDTAIHGFALVRRGRRVATAKYQIKFTDFVPLEPSIAIEELERGLPGRVRNHFVRTSTGRGGRLPQQTWNALVATILQMRPEVADAFRRLERRRSQIPGYLDRPGAETVVLERDSVNMALRFAGFDPVHVRNWIPEDEPAPFLTGLAAVRINEEQMIQHDAGVFGDWQLIRRNLAGTAVFYGPRGKRITLMNVNRHSVELTLGVDLLYYSEEFRSYVLVQYKRMRREGASFAYRPIDESYNREIGRMRDFCRDYPPAPLGPNLREFRLSPMPFYLKLCRDISFDPTSAEMIPGMYLPLDYWECLMSSEQTLGPRGGRIVTQENAGRYFSNTDFVAMVGTGWIGSRFGSTEAVTALVRRYIDAGHSLTLAASIPGEERS